MELGVRLRADLTRTWFHLSVPAGNDEERAKFIFEHGFLDKKKGLPLDKEVAEELLVAIGEPAAKIIHQHLLTSKDELTWDNLYAPYMIAVDLILRPGSVFELTLQQRKKIENEGGELARAVAIMAEDSLEKVLESVNKTNSPQLRAIALIRLQKRWSQRIIDKESYNQETCVRVVKTVIGFRNGLPEIQSNESTHVFKLRR